VLTAVWVQLLLLHGGMCIGLMLSHSSPLFCSRAAALHAVSLAAAAATAACFRAAAFCGRLGLVMHAVALHVA
jgi:hypothetical protein